MTFVRFILQNARWLCGGFLLCFCSSVGQTYFIALSGGEIRNHFNLSHGEFGGLYMAATVLSAMSLPFFGRIVDYRSVASTVLIVFCGLAACALLMWQVETVIFLFLTLYGLRLFGQGMMTHISMTAMGRWYQANRGRAVSISSAGLQLGEAILPIIMVSVMAAVGWRAGWLGAAFMLLVFLPIVFLLMRKERLPQSVQEEQDAEQGDVIRHWTRSEVLQDTYFWMMMIAVMAPAFIGTAILFHQAHLLSVKGWETTIFASSFFIMSISTFLSSLSFGVIIDRVSAVRILPIFLLPMGGASFLLASVDHQAIIFVFMALYGVSYGASSSLLGTIWPEIYGTKHLGSVRSVVVAFAVLSSAVGPGITGLLIDRGVTLQFQLQIMAFYCVAASCIMLFVAKGLISRRHLTKIRVTEQA